MNTEKLYPKWKEKKRKVMKVMLRKATKVHVYIQCFSLFSKPERTSWSLTPHLDTVIFEVSSVKELSLRGNTLRLYWAKHFPLMNWTYGDTGLYIGW